MRSAPNEMLVPSRRKPGVPSPKSSHGSPSRVRSDTGSSARARGTRCGAQGIRSVAAIGASDGPTAMSNGSASPASVIEMS